MTTKATKNAKGGGTIRKRSDGRWEARYTLGIDPKTGKQIQKSVYGKTQKEVRQKLTAITAEIDDGTYQEPCRMTLNEWLDIWLRDYLTGVKPSTSYLYQRQAKLYIRPALGSVRLDRLEPHTIQRFYNSLHEERDGKPPLSAKSIKNIHGILHKALQQAVLLIAALCAGIYVGFSRRSSKRRSILCMTVILPAFWRPSRAAGMNCC